MTNIRPIWTPRDAVDTAQQFHLELHNAERGRVERRLFSVSRERRARRMDALAVGLLLIVMAAFGCVVVLLSPQAKADSDDDWVVAYAYAATYGSAVCETLDSYPSHAGIYGIADAITDGGLTYHQAGQAIAISVMQICPRHTALIKSFAASTAGSHA